MAEVTRHLDNETWRVSLHAEDNMEIDGLTREMVRLVLGSGRHIEKQDEFSKTHGAWNYAVHGKTLEGEEIRVVVTFHATNMVVVNAFPV